MLNHVSIGVKDVARAKAFYDVAFQPLGYSCLHSDASGLGYGKDVGQFWISASKSPVPADPDSGLHFCFDARTRSDVDAFYSAALKAGGRDNGKPGIRTEYGPNYYAAFVIDPEGYRIEAKCTAA